MEMIALPVDKSQVVLLWWTSTVRSRSGGLMGKARDDFDNPWKEILRQYFGPFMAFFFPWSWCAKKKSDAMRRSERCR